MQRPDARVRHGASKALQQDTCLMPRPPCPPATMSTTRANTHMSLPLSTATRGCTFQPVRLLRDEGQHLGTATSSSAGQPRNPRQSSTSACRVGYLSRSVQVWAGTLVGHLTRGPCQCKAPGSSAHRTNRPRLPTNSRVSTCCPNVGSKSATYKTEQAWPPTLGAPAMVLPVSWSYKAEWI